MQDHDDIRRPTESLATRMWRMGPTVLVLAILAGVAYTGHHYGWTVPAFSDLFGAAKEKDDWCGDHNVPLSVCVEHDESLLPRLRSTWCKVHGVHNCPFERPEVAQLASLPTIDPEDLVRARRVLDLKERKENTWNCKIHERRLQVESSKVLDKMGVNYNWPVTRGEIVESIAASGELTFEQPRVAPASAPVAGRVWAITPRGVMGARVKRGDVLALLDAVEVGKAKTELLQAHAQIDLRKKTLDRLMRFEGAGAIADNRLLEAEVALREARLRMTGALQTLNNMGLPISVDDNKPPTSDELAAQVHFLGIPRDIASGLDPRTTTANLMPVVASRDGVVTAVKVSVGEMAESGKSLFVVADTSVLWLTLNVRLEDAKYLRVRTAKTQGQTVKFRADGSDRDISGELVWRSAEVDEKTRTVQVRAEVPNPDGSLLANTYGAGQIILRAEKQAIVVPTAAVHWEGDCHIVFVRDKNFLAPNGLKVFHVRTVRPGVTNGDQTEIIAGLLPGEIIATTNSAAFRTELLKNKLGEHCGCH